MAWTSLTFAFGSILTAAKMAQLQDNFGYGTGSVEPNFTASITIDGGRVRFPTTQVPSANVNDLDDYKEGTWNPAIGGTATYLTQTGRYTKIGRHVFITGLLHINVLGTGSTSVVSGLPFTVGSDSGFNIHTLSNSAVSVVKVGAQIVAADTTFLVVGLAVAGNSTATLAIFGNSTAMRFSGHYTI